MNNIELGTLIHDEYRLVKKLGEGGMGTVFLAMQETVERQVVVKFIHAHLLQRQESVTRFEREAKLLSQVQHPNVVHLFTAGETKHHQPFVVMEFIDGVCLSDLICQEGCLGVARALDIAAQVCSALAEAHARGIIHRDLKPDNIMLTQTADGVERVKVLDFGIAKLVADAFDDDGVTRTGAVMGTPRYMSPEQINTELLDARSDLYSLGIILFEMLTGRHPLTANNSMQYLVKHLSEPAPDLSDVCEEQPEVGRLDPLLRRLLVKDRGARFESATSLRWELLALQPEASHEPLSLKTPLEPRADSPLDGQETLSSPVVADPQTAPVDATLSSAREPTLLPVVSGVEPALVIDRRPLSIGASTLKPPVISRVEPALVVDRPPPSTDAPALEPPTPQINRLSPQADAPALTAQPSGVKMLLLGLGLGILIVVGVSLWSRPAQSPPPTPPPAPVEVPATVALPEGPVPATVALPEPPVPVEVPATIAPPETPTPTPPSALIEGLNAEAVAAKNVLSAVDLLEVPEKRSAIFSEPDSEGLVTIALGEGPALRVPEALSDLRDIPAAEKFTPLGRVMGRRMTWRDSYNKQTYTLRPDFDPDNFRVTAYYPKALAKARGIYPDAEFLHLSAARTRADGRTVIKGYSSVYFSFFSAANAAPSEAYPKNTARPCNVRIIINEDHVVVSKINADCDELSPAAPPTCTASDLWAKIAVDGQTFGPTDHAQISLRTNKRNGEQSWQMKLNNKTSTKFPNDCSD